MLMMLLGSLLWKGDSQSSMRIDCKLSEPQRLDEMMDQERRDHTKTSSCEDNFKNANYFSCLAY